MEHIIIPDKEVVEEIFVDSKTGKRCVIALNRFGYRLGYVELIDKIPFNYVYNEDDFLYNYLYKEDKNISSVVNLAYNLRDKRLKRNSNRCILIHGGVTFLGYKEVTESMSIKAIGFDCAHFNDACDKESIDRYFGKDSLLSNVISRAGKTKGHIWSIEDVHSECESLANQVKSIENRYSKEQKLKKKQTWCNRGWKKK